MTRDQEVLQALEEKSSIVLGKAQEFLTTALPGGPGAFAYIVMSNLVGKLFGHTKQYVEKAVNRPVTLPDFIYIEPLDEELEEFFSSDRLKSVRAEFPARSEDFSNNDWATLRRYYKPLYYTLVVKEAFVSEMFSFEIQSQNYKRIIHDFNLFSHYKKALQTVPSASKQNALWSAVTSVMKSTVSEVWSKDYAKQMFEDARQNPEVAGLIERVKTKIEEKVKIGTLSELRDAVKYVAGRSLPMKEQPVELPMKAIDCVAEIGADGRLSLPDHVINTLHLRTGTKVRLLVLSDE